MIKKSIGSLIAVLVVMTGLLFAGCSSTQPAPPLSLPTVDSDHYWQDVQQAQAPVFLYAYRNSERSQNLTKEKMVEHAAQQFGKQLRFLKLDVESVAQGDLKAVTMPCGPEVLIKYSGGTSSMSDFHDQKALDDFITSALDSYKKAKRRHEQKGT